MDVGEGVSADDGDFADRGARTFGVGVPSCLNAAREGDHNGEGVGDHVMHLGGDSSAFRAGSVLDALVHELRERDAVFTATSNDEPYDQGDQCERVEE